jgi:hypothetical protein
VKPYTLHHGDCLAVLRTLPDASVDAVVCDPPYGLSFMGARWDYDVPGVDVWAECLRVLKPGGHLLAFAGTRTQHRMAVRIEDAGFEIRDMIAWVYGSGFPKSLDVSKAIDKAAGAEREVVGKQQRHEGRQFAEGASGFARGVINITAPATDAARQWSGWGTALKPALEPITVARRPLDGTVAENVLAHGTGALNVDGCRVHRASDDESGWSVSGSKASENRAMSGGNYDRDPKPDASGRWPANFIHDGSKDVVGLFPETESGKAGVNPKQTSEASEGWGNIGKGGHGFLFGDSGSAARFFYCAKAAGDDRDAGALGLFWRAASTSSGWEQIAEALYWTENEAARKAKQRPPHVISQGNLHPTVKPADLMRYLCRLVTPPSGIVLDPFTGSGSTGRGAILEGFRFIGIEREADYLTIARARIEDAVAMRARETAQLTLI